MNKYKGIIFDLDGTLLNTIDDISDSLNYSLSKNGFKEFTVSEIKYFVGSGVTKLIERALANNKYKQEVFDKVMNDYSYAYNLWKENKTKPYDNIIKVLKRLKRMNLKMAVLSNKNDQDTKIIVSKYFPGIFDYVYGNSVYPLKPDPQLTLKIVSDFGLEKEEVLFVGDSNIDILTAQNANLDVCGCSYGFRTHKELVNLKATYVIDNPVEILNIFQNDYNGILLIDKPLDYTCQDIVSIIKRKLNLSKVGHAGTLDPKATGLLVILLGKATKLSDYILEENKTYIAEVTIGLKTNTLDCEGEVIETRDVEERFDVDNILKGLEGKLFLKPPFYSALKVDGKKSYEAIRKGIELDLKEKEMNIFRIERISDVDYFNKKCVFTFEIEVSKGTYIRSICEEIGKRLNYPSYMSLLRRVKSGYFIVEKSYTLDNINSDDFQIIDIVDALKNKKILELNEKVLEKVLYGQVINLDLKDELVFLVYKKELVAIYELISEGKYKAKRVWK